MSYQELRRFRAVTQQVCEVQPQSIGHPAQNSEGRVCNRALKLTRVRSVYTGEIGQFLLGNAHDFSLRLDGTGNVLSDTGSG